MFEFMTNVCLCVRRPIGLDPDVLYDSKKKVYGHKFDARPRAFGCFTLIEVVVHVRHSTLVK